MLLMLLKKFLCLLNRSTLFLPYLEDDMMRLELLLVSEDVIEDESGDINALEELEDSSQRHSSVGEKLTKLDIIVFKAIQMKVSNLMKEMMWSCKKSILLNRYLI